MSWICWRVRNREAVQVEYLCAGGVVSEAGSEGVAVGDESVGDAAADAKFVAGREAV